MPSPETIEIASGPFLARFVPAWGGRLTRLVHADLGDILVPTPDAPFDPLNWPRAGAYPLFPYHGRLAGAAFFHAGERYHVTPHPALNGDAMHGPAHRRPWRVVQKGSGRLVLSLDYPADADWPFAFRAEQSFVLSPEGLSVRLTLVNTGDGPMPGAIGWHPYFAASLDRHAETDAARKFLLDRLDVPTGAPPFERKERTVPARPGYTIHLTDWSHACVMIDGGEAVLSADASLAHIAVHRTERYLCFEPVSAAAGTLSLPEEQRPGAGLKTLAPGENLQGTIRLSVAPARPDLT